MSDVDEKQPQDLKEPSIGPENRQSMVSDVPQSFDGLPPLKSYDTAYPPLNQYSSQKSLQPLGHRKHSAWLASATPVSQQVSHPVQAPTPGGPGPLGHVMYGAPALPYGAYNYNSGNPGYALLVSQTCPTNPIPMSTPTLILIQMAMPMAVKLMPFLHPVAQKRLVLESTKPVIVAVHTRSNAADHSHVPTA